MARMVSTSAYVTLYDVYVALGGGSDTTPDRDIHGIYSDENQANLAAKGIGWWGGAGTVQPRKALQVLKPDNSTEWFLLDERADPETSTIDIDHKVRDLVQEAKNKALSKLTPEERKLLNLEEPSKSMLDTLADEGVT